MATELEFEVRLIGGAFAVVGEGVSFREENGKLLALNEDGEPFGVVPNRYAEQLRELEEQNPNMDATVSSRGDGVSTIRVAGDANSTLTDSIFQLVTTTKQVDKENAFTEETRAEAPNNASSSDVNQQQQTPPKPEQEDWYQKSSKNSWGACLGMIGGLAVTFLVFWLILYWLLSLS